MKNVKEMKLTTKVNAIVAFTLITVIAVTGYINNRLEVRNTISMTLKSAEHLSGFINRDIDQFMHERDISGIQNRLNDIMSEHKEIRTLRLINSRGIISASTVQEEIGRSIRPEGKACMACHYTSPPQEQIPRGKIGEIVDRDSGDKVVKVVSPIYNRPSCANADCHAHPRDVKILGLLGADFDFSPTAAAIERRKIQTAALAIIAVLLVTVVIAGFMWRYVATPLRRLLAGMKKIEDGDLDQRINYGFDDEIGLLAHEFNLMASGLSDKERKLKETNDYLTGIVENSTDFIITVDESDSIRTFNRGAERILGYKRDAIMTKNWRELFFEDTDLQGFLDELERENRVISFETRFRNTNGEPVEVLLTKSKLKNADGEDAGKLLIGVDITEYKQVQKKLIQAEQHAAVGQAITNILHGAKNILNSFRGGQYMVNTALKKGDQELLCEGWQVTENGIARITELTRDLLDFTRGAQLDLKKGSLTSLAKEVVWTFRQPADEGEIKVFSELDESLPEALIDSKALHSAIMNLVSNAVDACKWKEYADNENGEVTVRTYYDDESGMVCIEIDDNGCGIPEQTKKKIFTPFFSTKHSKGNGLGLPITKKIVNEHSGMIDVFSEVEKGTTFTIRLPRATDGERGEEKLVINN